MGCSQFHRAAEDPHTAEGEEGAGGGVGDRLTVTPPGQDPALQDHLMNDLLTEIVRRLFLGKNGDYSYILLSIVLIQCFLHISIYVLIPNRV